MDSSSVGLRGIDWLPDDELVRDAPAAQWQAYPGWETEQAGTWLAYTPDVLGVGAVVHAPAGCAGG